MPSPPLCIRKYTLSFIFMKSAQREKSLSPNLHLQNFETCKINLLLSHIFKLSEETNTNLWLTLIGKPRFLHDTSGKGFPVTVHSNTALVPSLNFWFCGCWVKHGASGSIGEGTLSSLSGALSAWKASLTGDIIGDPKNKDKVKMKKKNFNIFFQ